MSHYAASDRPVHHALDMDQNTASCGQPVDLKTQCPLNPLNDYSYHVWFQYSIPKLV